MKLFQYIIISSPSGAGKTTLSQMLLKDRRLGKFSFSVSHTTRPPREGEVDGRDYYFTDHGTFRKMVRGGEFAEHARVHGNRYGTSLAEIRRRRALGGDGIIFDIDYQGARQIKKKLPETLAIFILPPSIHELHRRLIKRGTESRKSLEIRFRNAIKEIRHFDIFDFVVTNDVLEEAYGRLVTVIKAHRLSGMFAEQTVRDLIDEWTNGGGGAGRRSPAAR
jgi:guanylate kinase